MLLEKIVWKAAEVVGENHLVTIKDFSVESPGLTFTKDFLL